jgi:hypothetical protein
MRYKEIGIDKGIQKLSATTDNTTGNALLGLSDIIPLAIASIDRKGNNMR